uniref:Uncharacterized protein n=1 Tax=Cacopsylla melanoneura TaxID=428564 RepID=A0A8D8VST1_9HEMI
MTSSLSLLVLAAACFIGVSSLFAEISKNESPDLTELKSNFNQTIQDLISYMHIVHDTADKVQFEEKVQELNKLVLEAQEVVEADAKLRTDTANALKDLAEILTSDSSEEDQPTPKGRKH